MHSSPCLLPSSNALCSSLDCVTVSSMTVRLPPTTNELDIKDKQRLLRQTRKLSQILGELPRGDTLQPHLESSSMPAVEAASTDHPQQRQQHIRFSKHSLMDSPCRPFRFPLNPRSAEASTMSPRVQSSSRAALGRSSSMKPLPAHPRISQPDSARLGLGRLSRARSTESIHPDESAQRVGRLSIVEKKPTRSSSLRIINHRGREKDGSRRRTVHNPGTGAFQTHSRRSTDSFTPTHSQRRSVSLWARRRITKDDPAHHQRSSADQGQEDDASDDSRQPLTEAQRIHSIRRGRKLAQVCPDLNFLCPVTKCSFAALRGRASNRPVQGDISL